MCPEPRGIPNSRLRCADCDAPVVKTADGVFVCTDCGSTATAEPPYFPV